MDNKERLARIAFYAAILHQRGCRGNEAMVENILFLSTKSDSFLKINIGNFKDSDEAVK